MPNCVLKRSIISNRMHDICIFILHRALLNPDNTAWKNWQLCYRHSLSNATNPILSIPSILILSHRDNISYSLKQSMNRFLTETVITPLRRNRSDNLFYESHRRTWLWCHIYQTYWLLFFHPFFRIWLIPECWSILQITRSSGSLPGGSFSALSSIHSQYIFSK